MNPLNPSDLVTPPAWSLAVGDLGRVLVLLSAALYALSAIAWVASTRLKPLEKVGRWSFTAANFAVLGSFTALGVLFATNRFEFEYVYGHNDTKNALAYRIAGIWSGQEGSFLLWASCAAVFALLTTGKTGLYRRWYTVATSFFLGGVTSILAFESPFKLNLFDGKPFVPADGLGLAPSLQNYWVIIHPPVIFLGFGSLTALFALAFSALVVKDYENWVPIVRPWSILALTLTGLGLCMGGFWAYETLGWGGFWMWDPVENTSFVPWCFTAALVHGLIVQATKKRWQMANLLLGALPFVIFVYGTFLTRSGFLSDASVHSFAEMDRSALKLLTILLFGTTLGFLGLWAFRAFQSRKEPRPSQEAEPGIGRVSGYVIAITSLLTLGAATAIGMSVPLVQALKGQPPKVVEEALYHQVLSWVFVPLMLLLAVAPYFPWKGVGLKDILSRVYTPFCVTVGITGGLLFATVMSPFGKSLTLSPKVHMLGKFEVNGLPWLMFLVGLCVFVLVSNSDHMFKLFKRSKLGAGSFLAHVGVGVLMAGLIISRGFEKKAQDVVMQNHPARLMGYEVRYAGMTKNERDRDNQLKLDVYDPHRSADKLFTARPGVYTLTMADGRETTMVWPHIERGWLMDTYVSLGQPQKDASVDVTLEPGKSAKVSGLILTYDEMTREGEMGQAGTKFGARVSVSNGHESMTVVPQLEVGGDSGPVQHPARLDQNMQLVLVGMDAATKSVNLKVQLTTPIYPIEVYHKPMTILVWLGTAILTLGGFIAAFYRRSRGVPQEQEPAKLKEHTTLEPVLATRKLQGKAP